MAEVEIRPDAPRQLVRELTYFRESAERASTEDERHGWQLLVDELETYLKPAADDPALFGPDGVES